MSFNFNKIVEETKANIGSKSYRDIVYNILGKCIAEDILSNTCECKPVWNDYDRYSLIKRICETLGLSWSIYIGPADSLICYYPPHTIVQRTDGLYYEPYRPENFGGYLF